MNSTGRSLLRRVGIIPNLVRIAPSGAPDSTDVFCDATLVHGDPGSEELALVETRHFALRLPRFPLAPGHLLVVPRPHVATIGDVPPIWHAEMARLVELGLRFQREVYGGETFLREQGSPVERQAVHHAHLHLIPVPAGTRLQPIEGARPLRSWLGLWHHRQQRGTYHYVQVGSERMVMADDGAAVGDAEFQLCTALGSVWDPVKRQATKFMGPEADRMVAEMRAHFTSWMERQRGRDLAA